MRKEFQFWHFTPELMPAREDDMWGQPTWRQVARGCACVTSSATDGWGPCARVVKRRKRMRRPGFEPGTSGTGGAGPSHWATLCFVLDLELLVILRWVGAIRLKLKEKFSTGLTTERGSSGQADGAGRLPRAAVAAACVRWCVRTKERKRRRRG